MRKDYSLGLHTNVRQLQTQQNKLNITYVALTELEVIIELKAAYKQRKKLKTMANDLSLEYRMKLALVKEEAGEIKAAVFLRNQNRIEDQRRFARNVRRMEGKMKGGNTTKINIDDKNGNTIELTNRVDIDKVMARENEKMGHQTEGGSQLLTKDYIECLGNHGEGTHVNTVLDGTF